MAAWRSDPAANQMEPVVGTRARLLERYGATPQAVSDYRWAVERFIDWCEKSGHAERARPLREWLESLHPKT